MLGIKPNTPLAHTVANELQATDIRQLLLISYFSHNCTPQVNTINPVLKLAASCYIITSDIVKSENSLTVKVAEFKNSLLEKQNIVFLGEL